MIHAAHCDLFGTRQVVQDASGVVRAAPASTEDITAVVHLCARHGHSIVPEGGRTGLVGSCEAAARQIVLSLSRMVVIEQIDPVERVAVMQAGVALDVPQTAARAHGLERGIDLAARGTTTIGVMAFRNDIMRHRVLGLEAALPNGVIQSDMTRDVKNSAGYDLKHLLIGAEGTLGIVMQVVLELAPQPQTTATILLGLPSAAAVFDAITLGLRAASSHRRAAERLWQGYAELAANARGWDMRVFPLIEPLYLLLMLGGATPDGVQGDVETLCSALLDLHPDTTGIIARSDRQAQGLWALREDTGQPYRAHPVAASYDVSVPLSQIANHVDHLPDGLSQIDSGIAPDLFGHLADGNLHLGLDRPGPLPTAIAAAVEAVLCRDLRAMGGSFLAEHGVGRKRIHALRDCTDTGKQAAMRLIKHALDPAQIMNPGKVLPPEPATEPRI